MDPQKFDATILSALQDLEVPYDPGTWAALEQRLDALPAPDAVDQLVKPSLERVELPFDPGAWTALVSKMDQIVVVRRLRRTKALELVIFLLLLSNLNGFFGVVGSVAKPKSPAKPQQNMPIAGLPAGHKASKTYGAKVVQQENAVTGLLDELIELATTVKPVQVESNAPIITTNETENEEMDKRSLLDPMRFYAQSGPVHFVDPRLINTKRPTPILYASKLPALKAVPSGTKPNARRLYASTFASFDKITVRESSHIHRNNNLGGGMAIGYRKGKWGAETGVSYAQKTYQPLRQNVEYLNDPFTGISFYYVDEVQTDVFTVPVKLTRELARKGRTSVHASAGFSTHLATSKEYRYETLHLPAPSPQPNPNPVPPPQATFPEGRGLLQDGGAKRNVYASADLGLRVEQAIGKRYVAYIEPAYRQSLGEGFGPGSSRINSLTVSAGVMAHL